jgi:hypothetical protein
MYDAVKEELEFDPESLISVKDAREAHSLEMKAWHIKTSGWANDLFAGEVPTVKLPRKKPSKKQIKTNSPS